MQPLYGAETSVDTRGTPEWGRWQHVSMSSQLTCDLIASLEKTGQHTEYVRLSKKKKEKKGEKEKHQHFLRPLASEEGLSK